MTKVEELEVQMERLAEPFARALAVFVREATRDDFPVSEPAVSSPASPLGPLVPFEQLEPALRARLDKLVDRQERALRAGKLDTLELTPDSPAQAAARRLWRVAKERGISQKALAAKLGVTPAVISRVFKNPDRSKVATLRKIAKALGAQLSEII